MSAGALQRLAECARLLVASDFDGVLAPIVDDPAAVEPLAESLEALVSLAALPDTHVAIVSGRASSVLRGFLEGVGPFLLVGSHGAELGETDLSQIERRRLREVGASLATLAEQVPGLHVEEKPLSVAVHYRRLAPGDRGAAAAGVEQLARGWPHKTIRGKELVEFAVRETNKGDAITMLRRQVDATSVLYLGDDRTDEDAFAALDPGDVGIKVGPGATIAALRVADPGAVASNLGRLAAQRAASAFSRGASP